jgi:hypothetical protein
MADAPKMIFKAELVDKEIRVEICTTHLPSLVYAREILSMHIMDSLVDQEIKKAVNDAPKILTPKIDLGGVKLA